MKQNYKSPGNTINTVQILIGLAGLLVGALVYLVDRPPDQTYFVFASPIKLSLRQILPNLFGLIGNFLPDFIHVFSFILITAGITSFGKKGYVSICLGWLIIDCAFELGQKYSTIPLKIIPDWFDSIPFLENAKNYFLKGTFDIVDVTAISLGALAAYYILLKTMKRREIA